MGVNRGCAAAFAAVYDCEVPVIAAVHGFCLGGGVGLVGNADIVVASDDATFGLPEVDRGALGRGHPSGETRTPAPDAVDGVHGPAGDGGRAARLRLGAPGRARRDCVTASYEVAAPSPRTAPPSSAVPRSRSTGIDPVDVKRSYRFEQGFTYELHVSGVADEQRQAFVEKRDADTST